MSGLKDVERSDDVRAWEGIPIDEKHVSNYGSCDGFGWKLQKIPQIAIGKPKICKAAKQITTYQLTVSTSSALSYGAWQQRQRAVACRSGAWTGSCWKYLSLLRKLGDVKLVCCFWCSFENLQLAAPFFKNGSSLRGSTFFSTFFPFVGFWSNSTATPGAQCCVVFTICFGALEFGSLVPIEGQLRLTSTFFVKLCPLFHLVTSSQAMPGKRRLGQNNWAQPGLVGEAPSLEEVSLGWHGGLLTSDVSGVLVFYCFCCVCFLCIVLFLPVIFGSVFLGGEEKIEDGFHCCEGIFFSSGWVLMTCLHAIVDILHDSIIEKAWRWPRNWSHRKRLITGAPLGWEPWA